MIFQIEGIKGYWIKTSSKKKNTQPKVWSSGCSVITGTYKLQGLRLNSHPPPVKNTRIEGRPLEEEEEEEASGYEQKYSYISLALYVIKSLIGSILSLNTS